MPPTMELSLVTRYTRCVHTLTPSQLHIAHHTITPSQSCAITPPHHHTITPDTITITSSYHHPHNTYHHTVTPPHHHTLHTLTTLTSSHPHLLTPSQVNRINLAADNPLQFAQCLLSAAQTVTLSIKRQVSNHTLCVYLL